MGVLDDFVGGVDDCAMAFKLTYCAGSGSFGYGCVGMHAEVEGLSRVLGEEIHGNIYAGEASRLGWPSPPQISTHRIVPAGGIDWRVMGRTRPITEEGGRAYFITEYLVCDPEEAGRLAGQEITPADILLIRDQTDLWFVGDRWDQPAQYYQKPLELVKPGQPANPARNVVIQVPSEAGLPSLWSRFGPRPGNSKNSLFPFQHSPCCWLADRYREIGEGKARGNGAVTLEPDGLLCLFNESSRALAEIGVQLEEDPGKQSQWLETPWRITFTTFALERDRSIQYEWVGCWQGVERHRSFLSEAECRGTLLDLDRPGYLDPDRLQANLLARGWIPGEEEPGPAEETPVAEGESRLPGGEPTKSEDIFGRPGLGNSDDFEPEFLDVPSIRETESETSGKLPRGKGLIAAGRIGAAVLIGLFLLAGIHFVRESGKKKDRRAFEENVEAKLAQKLDECEVALTGGDFADYEKLRWLTRSLDALVRTAEQDFRDSPAEPSPHRREIERAKERVAEYGLVSESAAQWHEKLSHWDLTEPIASESVPGSLGKNAGSNDELAIRKGLQVANCVIEADSPGDLISGGAASGRAQLREAKEATRSIFREPLESIEERSQVRVREKIQDWEKVLAENAARAFLRGEESELTAVLAEADALERVAGEWIGPESGSFTRGRKKRLGDWTKALQGEVGETGFLEDGGRQQKLLFFLKAQALGPGMEDLGEELAEVEEQLKHRREEPAPGPEKSAWAATLLLPRSENKTSLEFDLPVADGFELKRIKFVSFDLEKLSPAEKLPAPGEASFSVPITREGGRDSSWEEVRTDPGSGNVRIGSDFSRLGNLERTGSGGARLVMAPESFRADFAILEMDATDRGKPEPSNGRLMADSAESFLLSRSRRFDLASVPVHRFFVPEEESPEVDRLRIRLGSHQWRFEYSIWGFSREPTAIRLLGEVRTSIEEEYSAAMKRMQCPAAAAKKFRDWFLSRESNKLSETGWTGEPDLIAGVRRLDLTGYERRTSYSTSFDYSLRFEGRPLSYSFRDFLAGRKEPLGGVVGRRKNTFRTFEEALWSYGLLALETFLGRLSPSLTENFRGTDFGSSTSSSSRPPSEEKEEALIFYLSDTEKSDFTSAYQRAVQAPASFELFKAFANYATGVSADKVKDEKPRVQNRWHFMRQWSGFAERLNDPEIGKFFEWEKEVLKDSGAIILDPDQHFDKYFGSRISAQERGMPLLENLGKALENPGPELNKMVKIEKLELVQDKK